MKTRSRWVLAATSLGVLIGSTVVFGRGTAGKIGASVGQAGDRTDVLLKVWNYSTDTDTGASSPEECSAGIAAQRATRI